MDPIMIGQRVRQTPDAAAHPEAKEDEPMRLLTIGNTTINLALAIEIEDHGDRIEVFYAIVNADGRPVSTSFEGDDAAVLRSWIQRNAEHMGDFQPGSTGAPLNDPQPYTSPR